MPLNNFPKFQTVAWWIKQLKEFPKDAVVALSTSEQTALCMLSIYENKYDPLLIHIDIGRPDE